MQNKIYREELSNVSAKQIGTGCTIHSHVWIGRDVKIGNKVRIQAFSFIPDGVEIGDNAFIGPHVCFTNDKNPPSDEWQKTYVGRFVSIGASSTILPGVKIGERALVGAGSVVTTDIPEGEVWVGNPARYLRKR